MRTQRTRLPQGAKALSYEVFVGAPTSDDCLITECQTLFNGACSAKCLGIWQFDIRALSAPIVRGVEPGITCTCSGVYNPQILVIVSLRVCGGSQQTRSFSSEFTAKRKFQHEINK